MPKEIKETERYKAIVNKAAEYILDHLHEPLDLKFIAAIACMSPFHFHRIFTRHKGETLSVFIQRNRIEKAARLILSGKKLFFHEIASECGFSSQSLLAKTFRKYYGMTAHEYRKRIKNDIK